MTNETDKPNLDLSSPLDQPLDMNAVDARMRAEAPFMNPPIDRLHLLDDGPSLRDRLANLLRNGKRKLAVGTLAVFGMSAAAAGIGHGVDGANAEHSQLAKQGAQEAHKYLTELNGVPQSGFDAQGNRIVFENGQPRVIPKAELNTTSGNK